MKTAAKRRITFKFKLLILACFLVYAGVAIFIQQSNISGLNTKQAELTEQYAQAQQDLSRLLHQYEYRATDNYIRNAAREKLGLAYKDEIILIP